MTYSCLIVYYENNRLRLSNGALYYIRMNRWYRYYSPAFCIHVDQALCGLLFILFFFVFIFLIFYFFYCIFLLLDTQLRSLSPSDMSINGENFKKYQIFSKESIELFGESIGISNVAENVFPLISEDVVYRIREVINNSLQFLKHCKRSRLTCDDINKALRNSDISPIYGYDHNLTKCQEVWNEEANVYTIQEKIIDLVEISENIIGGTYKTDLTSQSPQYRIDLLSVEPKIKKELTNSFDQKPNQETLKIMSSFNNITKAILGNDPNQLKIVLIGLSSTPNVQHILSFLVKFFVSNVIISNHNLKVLYQLLLSMRALSMNNGLHLATEPFMSPLINSLLHCILSPTTTTNINSWYLDHWNFRDFAAFILAQVFKEWSSSFIYNKMYNQVILALTDCINDHFRPFPSHYGAIVAFTKLGLDVVLDHLYPSLSSYLNFLQITLNGSTVNFNQHSQFNAQKVFGAICNVAILLTHKLKQDTLTEDGDQYSNIYYDLYEFFGDALSIRIPTNCDIIRKLYYTPYSRTSKLCQPCEIQQSGEELLDIFYETKDNQSDEIKSDSLLDSDEDDKDLAPNTDLLIQSTISDPAIGVKLTIRKIVRAQASSEESEDGYGARSVKRKKRFKAFQPAVTYFFERIELKRNCQIRIQGPSVSQRYITEQKRPIETKFEVTSWYKISKGLKITSKRPNFKNKFQSFNNLNIKLCSCNLLSIL